jgi:hypothetical protein
MNKNLPPKGGSGPLPAPPWWYTLLDGVHNEGPWLQPHPDTCCSLYENCWSSVARPVVDAIDSARRLRRGGVHQ